MSNVQITPTRTNTVKPIRIHRSGVRCFQIISGLASGQPHDAEPVYRCADVSPFRNKTQEVRVLDRRELIRWPEFGLLPGRSVRPACFVRFLSQKPRQLETATVGLPSRLPNLIGFLITGSKTSGGDLRVPTTGPFLAM
jgi:hypothetical protein